MKYKVGDKVRIKSLDWYNENKDEYGYIDCGSREFFTKMSNWCGKIATIKEICKTNCYRLEEYDFDWTDEMIEGLVEDETKPKFKVGDRIITNKGYIGKFECWVSDYQVRVLFEESGCNVVIHSKDLKLMEEEDLIPKFGEYSDNEPLDIPTMTTEFVKEYGLPCPECYIFKDENGNVINATKIVLEKKGLTQERINTIVHESCILFCEHCGCGVPRDTCMSLVTCEEYDDYRKHIRTYLENYGNTNKERLA